MGPNDRTKFVLRNCKFVLFFSFELKVGLVDSILDCKIVKILDQIGRPKYTANFAELVVAFLLVVFFFFFNFIR